MSLIYITSESNFQWNKQRALKFEIGSHFLALADLKLPEPSCLSLLSTRISSISYHAQVVSFLGGITRCWPMKMKYVKSSTVNKRCPCCICNNLQLRTHHLMCIITWSVMTIVAIMDKGGLAMQSVLKIPWGREVDFGKNDWTKLFSANLGICHSKIINLMLIKILIVGNVIQSVLKTLSNRDKLNDL